MSENNTATAVATETNNRKRFLPAEMGLNASGRPHAFHLEGYISKPPYYRAATADKDAYLGFNIGVGSSPDRLMALADGSYDKDKDYGEPNGFIRVNVFGTRAEELNALCAVGVRVAVAGNIAWREFTTKEGKPGRELILAAEYVVVMGSRTTEAQLADNIGYATRVITGKDGVNRSYGYAELVTGEVVSCNPLNVGPTGTEYLSFGIKMNMPAEKVYALSTGTHTQKREYDTRRRVMNVVVFRKSAVALANVLRIGAQVVVSGPVEENDYNGNLSYRMQARCCSIMKFPPKTEDGTAPATGASAAPAAADAAVTVVGVAPPIAVAAAGVAVPVGAAVPAGTAAAVAAEPPMDFSTFAPMDDEDDKLPF